MTGRRRHLLLTSAIATALGAGLLSVPSAASAADLRISDVQGDTRLSPFAGQSVSGVSGVVTAVRAFGSARGFWFQDPQGDGNAATSEGLFVFTGSTTPAVAVGDAVTVAGRVTEFYPGGAALGLQSVTELTGATWTVASSGNAVPASFTLDDATVPDRFAPDAGGGSMESLPLKPTTYALDRYESLEGMRVALDDAPVVGPSTSFNELWLTAEPAHNRTARGGVLYGSYRDPNGGRVKVASLLPFATNPFPQADVGDELRGTTAGPLDYDQFGGYELQATQMGELVDNGPARESTQAQADDELSVATYNVENLTVRNAQSKFDALAAALVHNLAAPDIVALEEVQDDNGATNDSLVTANATLQKLTDAVRAAGGPSYAWRQIDPVDDQDGGQPGGNIRVAFLYNPERVGFDDIAGGDSTTPVGVVADGSGQPALTASPGRIAPGDAAWTDSRKPLAGQFTFRGKRVFVVANHFNSKGGDQGLDSRFQPPARTSEVQRVQQATLVNGFVKDVLAVDPEARVVVAGDINDFPFSPALEALTACDALTDLVNKLPRNERYGYVFNGNSQVLDHILVSDALGYAAYDVVHINAEYSDQISDHDPSVTRFRP
ncbi:endonuclease/exonuclease/phosphatase family protein [Streptomyces sp. NPDC051940]|uniref:endonuclease/exonuclease/phosphatase family protein n=1 Tax=Streptomyces sp. NPDC051940 TaxID=3155675 RepID=UPI0034128DE3